MPFRITWKLHAKSALLASLMTIILYKPISGALLSLCLSEFAIYPTQSMSANVFIGILLILLPVIFLHEGIHGCCYRIFGGKVNYGMRWGFAYCQEVSGKPLTLTQFMMVLLTPLTILSVASIFINGWLGIMVYSLNVLGSAGDLMLALEICKLSYKSRIVDRSYGFDVIEERI